MNQMDIKTWAKQKDVELRERIKYFIAEGIDKKKAVEMVLTGSVLGQGYHAQIRYDFLGRQIPKI